MEFSWLPDDLLHHLMKYLDPADCLALSSSGVSERFAILYGQQRTFSIARSYSVTVDLFQYFLRNYATPQIRSLDVSHCYWLPVSFFMEALSVMCTLEELYVHDTQLSLIHLPQVFHCCQKLNHLSVSFSFKSWDQFYSSMEDVQVLGNGDAWTFLQRGLGRLKFVKMTGMNATYCESWLVVLRILRWCLNCTDLHLEPTYTEEYFMHGPFGDDEFDSNSIKFARTYLFEGLVWMENLKSFIYVKRGCLKYADRLIEELCRWMFQELHMRQLERLWIHSIYEDLDYGQSLPQNVKSFNLGYKLPLEHYDKCRELTHVGGVEFSALPHLENLRFFRGFCSSAEGLDQFCRSHPSLQHLFLDNDFGNIDLSRDWTLPRLQTLVYLCVFNSSDVTERLMDACPNIRDLHLGYLNGSAVVDISVDALDRLCLLKRLRKLTLSSIDLVDIEPLIKIFKECRQLECLHLSDLFYESNASFLTNLIEALPLANNMREFRLHWKHGRPVDLTAMLSAARQWPRLERFVLYHEVWEDVEAIEFPSLPEFLCQFVSGLRNLVALCLIDKFDPSDIEPTRRLVTGKIQPGRPAFWFHVGHDLPEGSDPTVPRIHYDDVINPVNYYHIPPKFF